MLEISNYTVNTIKLLTNGSNVTTKEVFINGVVQTSNSFPIWNMLGIIVASMIAGYFIALIVKYRSKKQ